jgi:hypothetical protein
VIACAEGLRERVTRVNSTHVAIKGQALIPRPSSRHPDLGTVQTLDESNSYLTASGCLRGTRSSAESHDRRQMSAFRSNGRPSRLSTCVILRPMSRVTGAIKRVARYVWRYLTFAAWTDTWSELSPAERVQWRASWPAWRRAVRPVGVTIFWVGAVYFGANSDRPKTIAFVSIYLLWIAIWLTCAVIGLVDRRRIRRGRQAPASTTPG